MDTTDMPDLMPMDTEAMDTHTDTDTMARDLLMLNHRSLPTELPFPMLLPLPTPSLPPMAVWSILPWSEFAPTTSVPRSLANLTQTPTNFSYMTSRKLSLSRDA